MADIGCQARAQDLKESEVVERFKARVKNIHLPANIEGCSGMYGSSSLQGVNAFRHGKWVFIPKILLLSGDIILDHITHQIRAVKDTVLSLRLRAFFTPTQLPFSQPTDNNSCHMRTDVDQDSDEENSAADDDDDGDLGYKSRSCQQGCNIPLPSTAMQTCIHQFLTKLFGVSMVVVLATNVFRFVFSQNSDWLFLFLVQPSYIAMTVLPSSLRLFWRAIDVVGNAHLMALLHSLHTSDENAVQFDPQDEQMSPLGDGAESNSREPGTPFTMAGLEKNTKNGTKGIFQKQALTVLIRLDRVAKKHVPFRTILSFTKKSLLNQWDEATCFSGLFHSENLLESLGSTTVVYCVDKEGVLSEIAPTPERILVMKKREASNESGNEGNEPPKLPNDDDEGGTSTGETSTLDDDHPDPGIDPGITAGPEGDVGYFYRDAFQIFNLIVNDQFDRNPESESFLKFDNKNWPDFISTLKPIGLSCRLHALQALDEHGSPMSLDPYENKGADPHLATTKMFIDKDNTVLWGKYAYHLSQEIGITGEDIKTVKKTDSYRLGTDAVGR
uniref:Uncharacterized protein n=1 Tax=Eutreptiella gymnastica TaxID=73025 RepID=A0A7S1N0Q6_9EUGL